MNAPSREWDELRATASPISDGGRSWYPFEIRSEVADAVAALPDPVAALAARLDIEPDPVWCATLLVLLAHCDDGRVDDLLITALDVDSQRALGIYLLGAIGSRGWPKRSRDLAAVRAAVARWTDDPETWLDPVHEQPLAVEDLALAAAARLAGLASAEQLADLDPARPLTAELLGLELARFSAAQRAVLRRRLASR